MTKGFDHGGAPARLSADVVEKRLNAERAGIAKMLDTATPPDAMRAAPVAPARGAKRLVTDFEVSRGGTRRILGQHWEGADVFSAMQRDAWLRHLDSGQDEEDFVAPFTSGQIAMARHYRDLTERHAAGGVKCSSLEAGRGGGEGRGFMDAYVNEGRELDRLHRCIGEGEALALRRIRPSARGTRRGIGTRALVDRVCLSDQTLGDVLRAYGWAVKGDHRAALRGVLCGALDRMQGYR